MGGAREVSGGFRSRSRDRKRDEVEVGNDVLVDEGGVRVTRELVATERREYALDQIEVGYSSMNRPS